MEERRGGAWQGSIGNYLKTAWRVAQPQASGPAGTGSGGAAGGIPGDTRTYLVCTYVWPGQGLTRPGRDQLAFYVAGLRVWVKEKRFISSIFVPLALGQNSSTLLLVAGTPPPSSIYLFFYVSLFCYWHL